MVHTLIDNKTKVYMNLLQLGLTNSDIVHFFCSPDTCVKLPLPLITSRLVTSSMRIRFVVYLDMALCITSTIYGNWWW